MQNENKAQATNVAKLQRTVSGILWEKFLDTLERHSWGTIGSTALKATVSITLAACLWDAREAGHMIAEAMRWQSYAIPKTSGAFVLVFGWRVWGAAATWVWNETRDTVARAIESTKPEMPTWYGIPVPELVDYLFENRTFKRDEVEQRFALPRNRFEEMAKQMDSAKILKRGENNARVLNPDFSRSDVSTMMMDASETGELPWRLFRKEGEGAYTSEPSMPGILERSPTPEGFIVRKLHADSAT